MSAIRSRWIDWYSVHLIQWAWAANEKVINENKYGEKKMQMMNIQYIRETVKLNETQQHHQNELQWQSNGNKIELLKNV